MRFPPRGALLALLAFSLLLTVPGGPASSASAQSGVGGPGPVTFEVQLQTDGDAIWTVSTTIPLRNASDRAAFRDLAESFERGGEGSFSADVFRRAAAAASRETGRHMAIRAVSHNATIIERSDGPAVGRLALRLRWTNFARVDGSRLHVGDAFNTTNGTWFSGLGSGQTLVLRPPPNHNVVSAPIGPSAGVLRWEGPAAFEPGYLTVTYEQTGFGLPAELLAVGGAAFLVIVIGAVVLTRRGRLGLPGPAEPNGGEAASLEAESSTVPPADDADEAADETLLSDEERVERLLERNGGRMKQARIVKETGWSNAKVSQLLSTMDEDDRVNKLRIGRENLISLPDEDVGRIE